MICDYLGGQIDIDPRDGQMFDLMARSMWERAKVNYMLEHLHPGSVFVDAGAYIGYFTLIAASLVSVSGRVYAFEPSYSAAQTLSKNVERNHYDNVTVHPKALNRERGLVHFYHRQHSAWGTLLDIGYNPTQVYGVRLDDILDGPIDLMKVDVEGAEADVLAGAGKLKINALMIDLHPELGVSPAPVESWLGDRYRLFDIRSGFIPIQKIPRGLVELLAVHV